MSSQNSSARQPEFQLVDRICPDHGPYKARCIPLPFDDLPPAMSNCPVCVADAAARREVFEQAQREAEYRATVQRLMTASLIPQRYRDARIDAIQGDTVGIARVRKACETFVSRWPETKIQGPSIIMCGRPGTGKTHLACAIARELVERYGSRVLFHTALSAIRSVKETYGRESEISESDALARLVNPDLLILDEIGVQIGSDHERMLAFEIINERYQQCRSTILLSNLNRADLGEYLGDRIMDRFRECGGVLAFDWASYRGSRA